MGFFFNACCICCLNDVAPELNIVGSRLFLLVILLVVPISFMEYFIRWQFYCCLNQFFGRIMSLAPKVWNFSETHWLVHLYRSTRQPWYEVPKGDSKRTQYAINYSHDRLFGDRKHTWSLTDSTSSGTDSVRCGVTLTVVGRRCRGC